MSEPRETTDTPDTSTAPDAITTLLDAARITAVLPGPHGRILATVQQLNGKGTDYVTQLHELTADEMASPGTSVQLTRSDESVSAVSPLTTEDSDGRVYFLSSRPAAETDPNATEHSPGASLWVLPGRGEAQRLLTRPWGFNDLRASERHLVTTFRVHSQAENDSQHAELVEQRTTASVSGILHTTYPSRYWDHDLPAGRTVLGVAELPATADQAPEFRWVALPQGRLLDWDLSRDGSFVVATLQQNTAASVDATVAVRIDLPSGETTELIRSTPETSVSTGQISPDGTRVVLHRHQRWTPQQNLQASTHLFSLDKQNAQNETRLWPELDRWVDPIWVTNRQLAATSDDLGAGAIWYGADDDAAPQRMTPQVDTYTDTPNTLVTARHYSGLTTLPRTDATLDDTNTTPIRLYALADAITQAPEPIVLTLATDTAEILPLAHPGTPLRSPGQLRSVTATAEDGTELRAWLVTPEGPGPHPLAVLVHGGPWGSWNAWTYRWNPGAFVEAGYAVLLPDPAISTGYGQSMIDRGQQQLGGTPYTDILALTDAALLRPEIDESRTALAGGSYGGYMANWMAGHTEDRFRCIVTHASLWDTTSMGRTTDNAEWDRAMAEQSAEFSPHLYAEQIQVPLLVIHGNQDHRVPIGQALELWHALHTRTPQLLDDDGATVHRYLYYPDEGHWILKRGNAESWYRTVLDFLDVHVRGETSTPPATLG
ncbi:alpha/beta hydrolase family protein [Citricoccus sp. NR2]|uniref:alpha/beta hydrolase family protein n=1 Tax=Citricoccus sp. NR2 TaxID=3004095 RepID=UPI0022DDF612|nr:alpha/beta fold hydrolase [Citricoccus sp. NR2]WBL18389.1 alpha/beta fold hydrolase [Citricoccus sp. NR2]